MSRFSGFKRFFNMVEVTMALGVTAVGVAGVMTVLPTAMRTNQTATRNAYLADMANIIFSEIDVKAQELQKKHDDATSDAERETVENEFAKTFDTGYSLLHTYLNLEQLLSTTEYSDSDGGATGVLLKCDKLMRCSNDGAIGVIRFFLSPDDMNDASNLNFTEEKGITSNIGRPVFCSLFRVFVTDVVNDGQSHVNTDGSDAGVYRQDAIKYFVPGADRVVPQIQVDPETGRKKLVQTALPKEVVAHNYDMDSSDSHLAKNGKSLWRRVYIEMSWPATQEKKRRQKYYFVKEYYLLK